MQLEHFIQFIIQYNALLIEGLVGLIVLCVLFLAYRGFLAAKEAELHPDTASPSLGQLEETLKKLLEKANQVPIVGSAAAGSAGPETAPLLAEIAELKTALESRQAEIETLRTAAPEPAADGAAPAAAAGLSSEEKTALEAQIKELQAKLAEYEIISEDIADLSFYKEEHAKLQKQLEGLKNGAGAAAEPPAAAAPAAAPAPAKPPPTMVEPKSRAGALPAAAEPAPAAAEPAPAAAVETPAAPTEEASTADLSELTPTPTAAPETATTAAAADEDIMKEFQEAVDQQVSSAATPAAEAAAPAEPAVDLGTMDLDKVVAEAEGLSDAKVDDVVNPLEAGPDADKLLAEAASMDPGKSEDAQLMGQFENFVKKG